MFVSILVLGGAVMLEIEGIAFATSSATVTANVVVESVCYISLSPNAISFGSLYPTATQADNVPVTDYDPNGNAAANVLVYGGNWISGSNSFGVSNTTWSATLSNVFLTTNPLTTTPTVTGITIATPTLTANDPSNTIYFGLSVPGAIPAGTYTQIITIENSC